MTGHIRKRGKSSWELHWYAGGKHLTKTVRGTKRDAQREMARIAGDIATGDYVAPAKVTVAALVRRWLRDMKPSMEQATWEWYEVHLRLYVIPHLGDVKLASLSPLEIQGFYTKLAESGEVKRATIYAVHRALRRVLLQAVKWRLLQHSPMVGVQPPPGETLSPPNPMTAEEVQRFLEAAQRYSRPELYFAAITTGMRLGELLALRWQEVDLENHYISVTGSLTRTRTRKRTKTATSERRIPIPPQLSAMLDNLPRLSEYVWCTPSGRPLRARNVLRQFHMILEKAEIERRSLHDLRHTHATLLLQAGVHPKIVQERLGHKSIETTINLYSHVMPSMQGIAVTKLSDVLGLKNTPKLQAPEQALRGDISNSLAIPVCDDPTEAWENEKTQP